MRSRLTGLAKALRNRSTDAERLLWRHLRARQMEGLKFRRQQPIGDYIVDFVCLEEGLVIEVDGGHHAGGLEKEKDTAREQWLEEQGFTVLRFWDNEVLSNTEGVLKAIREVCEGHPPPAPPLKGGELGGEDGSAGGVLLGREPIAVGYLETGVD